MPGALAEIIGNETAVKLASSLMTAKEVPVAMFFHGPSGVGKFQCAVELARRDLCENVEKPTNCVCDSCRGIRTGESLTVRMMRGRIDKTSLRKIREFIYVRSSAQRKFVIMEFDDVDDASQDVMLKFLEEPPSGIHFILVASTSRVHPTIKSRSVEVNFGPCTNVNMIEYISTKRKAEFEKVDDKSKLILVAICNGSIGELDKFLINGDMREKVLNVVFAFFDKDWSSEFMKSFEDRSDTLDHLKFVGSVAFGMLSGICEMSSMWPSSKLLEIMEAEARTPSLGSLRRSKLMALYMGMH